MNNFLSQSARILESYPQLCAYGFRKFSLEHDLSDQQFDDSRTELLSQAGQLQIQTVYCYLQENSFTLDRHSYSLKHAAESWGRDRFASFVTNGAAIVGATLFGYVPSAIKGTPNCKLQWLQHELPIFCDNGGIGEVL